MTETQTTTSQSNRTSRLHRRHGPVLVLGILGILGAFLVVPAAIAAGRAMGGGCGMHGMLGMHGPRWGGEPTAEGIREHMGFVADRVLLRTGASDDQVGQVDAILDDLAPALLEQRLAGRDLHRQVAAALAAEQVDEAELERLRKEMLAHIDEASQIVVPALADLASVLTAGQRGELAEIGRCLHGGL